MPRRSFGSRKYSNTPAAEKHYILSNAAGITAGTNSDVVIADSDNGTNNNSVKSASKVKAVFCSVSLAADTLSASDTFGVLLCKVPGGLVGNVSSPNGVLNSFTQSITFMWLRMTPRTQNTAHNFIGWVKVPPRHQVFNEGDTLLWRSNSGPTSTFSVCANFVYKSR